MMASDGVRCALAAILVLIPGWVVARATLGARGEWSHRLAVALAVSPGLLAAGGLLAMRFHAGAWGSAAIVLAFVVAVAAALAILSGRAGAPVAGERLDRPVFAFALAVAAVCASFPILSEWWRISSDAWTHEGIVRAIAREGVPPSDPWYAGLPLHYAWLYHVAVGLLQAWSRADAFSIMALLAVGSGVTVALSVGRLARQQDAGSPVPTLLLLFLGMNACFPLLLPLVVARGFVGHDPGLAKVARLLSLAPFGWDRVGAFLRMFGAQDFFLNKFLVATPLSLALAAFTAWLGTLGDALAPTRRTPSTPAIAALCSATAAAMHPVVALDVGAMLGVVWLTGWFAAGSRAQRSAITGWAVASGVGFLPAMWFIATTVRSQGGAHDALPLGFDPMKIFGMLATCALGIGFGLRAWRARALAGDDAEERGRRRVWFAIATVSLGLGCVLRLPGPSGFFTVDKFSYLAWIPIVVVAGPELRKFWSRRSATARLAWALALFLPVNGLALASRAFDPHFAVRQPWARDEFVWMRSRLPADAVLLTPPRDVDIAVFAQRDQFYGLDADALLRGYPTAEMAARRQLVAHFFASDSLAPAEVAALRELHRPVYAVRTGYAAAFWRTTPGAWADPRPVPLDPGPGSSHGIVERAEDFVVEEVLPAAAAVDSTRR
jgi:hypothetical protein